MRILVCALAFAAAGSSAASAAAAPRVDVMVVGKSRVLAEPRSVVASAFRQPVGSKRCAVSAGTPLAALAALRRGRGPAYGLRDLGACGSRAADAGSLFVTRIGPDVNRGRNGWVYKVGRRVGTTGAADRTGPFGTGRRLAAGSRLTWFWCVQTRTALCQRTLEATVVPGAGAPGARIRVLVRGFDDNGRGVRVPGATVRLGSAVAVSGADGIATLTAPAGDRPLFLVAERRGMVRSFRERVRIG